MADPAATYFQKAGQHKRLVVRVGDRSPSAEMQLIRNSDGLKPDISAGAGHIEVQKAGGSYLISGVALNMASGADGRAQFDWRSGDLNTVGTYKIVFKISELGDLDYFSVPEYPFQYVLKVS